MKTVALLTICLSLTLGSVLLVLSQTNTPHPPDLPAQPIAVTPCDPQSLDCQPFDQTSSSTPAPTSQPPSAPTQTTNSVHDFNRPRTYKIGDTGFYTDGSTITLTTINDSRCQRDVVCIWAGELAPTFTVVMGSSSKSTEVTLGSVRATTTTVGGMTYTLVHVSETEATIIVEPAAVTLAPNVPVVKATIATKKPIRPVAPDPEPDTSFTTVLRLAIEKETNAFRRSQGLPALEYLPELATNAGRYSRHLQQYSYLSHTDRNGCDMSCRFAKDGFSSSATGENLAMMSFTDRPDVAEVASFFMTQWKKSAGHRDNLLSERFTHQGIGISINDSSVYVTVHFAYQQ